MFKFLILFTLSLGVSSTSTVTLAQSINHRDRVVKHLEGVMTASIEREENSIRVQMTTCKVRTTKQVDSVFLYQEQGLVGKLDRPYRQRFLEVVAHDDLVLVRSYKPDNLDVWVNSCELNKVEEIRNRNSFPISLDDLGQLVCIVTIKPYLSVYLGNTPPQGCPTDARGATTITNRIILHSTGMDTWDRGFDRGGNQIWGAKDRAYQFRR